MSTYFSEFAIIFEMRVTLFLPVRNEIIGSKIIMPRINPRWVDEIIVVDGNSTDGSREYYESLGTCKIISQKSSGVCGAYWECFEIATGDVIIAFSPDGNSIPELIPALIEKMKSGEDIVMVSRYLDGAKSFDDDQVTRFGNWMFTAIVNILFGMRLTDSLVMFRAYKKSLVERLALDIKTLPVFELQIVIRAAKAKLRISEIPGDEPKRIGGQRKMRPLYNGSCLLYLILKELFFWRSPESSHETTYPS